MIPTIEETRAACEYLNKVKGHRYTYRIWEWIVDYGDLLIRTRKSDGLIDYVTRGSVVTTAQKKGMGQEPARAEARKAAIEAARGLGSDSAKSAQGGE